MRVVIANLREMPFCFILGSRHQVLQNKLLVMTDALWIKEEKDEIYEKIIFKNVNNKEVFCKQGYIELSVTHSYWVYFEIDCVLSTSILTVFNGCLCVRHSGWKACIHFSICTELVLWGQPGEHTCQSTRHKAEYCEWIILICYGFFVTWLGSLSFKGTWSLADLNNTNAYQIKTECSWRKIEFLTFPAYYSNLFLPII